MYRYTDEKGAIKASGRSKTANLARLKKDRGAHSAASVTQAQIVNHFRARCKKSGPVVISAQTGYLYAAFKTARSLWNVDAPVTAKARSTLRPASGKQLMGQIFL
jgi:hypothetical protein